MYLYFHLLTPTQQDEACAGVRNVLHIPEEELSQSLVTELFNAVFNYLNTCQQASMPSHRQSEAFLSAREALLRTLSNANTLDIERDILKQQTFSTIAFWSDKNKGLPQAKKEGHITLNHLPLGHLTIYIDELVSTLHISEHRKIAPRDTDHEAASWYYRKPLWELVSEKFAEAAATLSENHNLNLCAWIPRDLGQDDMRIFSRVELPILVKTLPSSSLLQMKFHEQTNDTWCDGKPLDSVAGFVDTVSDLPEQQQLPSIRLALITRGLFQDKSPDEFRRTHSTTALPADAPPCTGLHRSSSERP